MLLFNLSLFESFTKNPYRIYVKVFTNWLKAAINKREN